MVSPNYYCSRIQSYFETFSQGLAATTVIAKVNGALWDLDRPFEKDSSLELIKFDDEQGNLVRHCFKRMLEYRRRYLNSSVNNYIFISQKL